MVCQLRPLVYSLGLNNPPRTGICLTPRKLRVKNLWLTGTVDVKWRVLECGHLLSSAVKCRGLPQQVKLLGDPLSSGLRIAKFRGQVKPVAIRSQIHTSVCGIPCDGYSILGNPCSKRRGLPQSAAHIWVRNLARKWIAAPAILHRESPCLKPHIFLLRDF
jgi:hypothetical protein